MTALDTEEIELLTGTVRQILTGPPDDVSQSLEDAGWQDVVADDPVTATRVLFAEHGRALADTSLLDEVVLGALGWTDRQPGDLLLYPLPGSTAPASSGSAVSGLVLRPPAAGARVVVPVGTPDGVRLTLIAADRLEATSFASFDPESTWRRLEGTAPDTNGPVVAWEDGVAAAQLALAVEINAISAETVRIAVEHTSTRIQYGKPIATFQAVRHRLAEAQVVVAGTTALYDAAFADGTRIAAAAAKAQAGRAHQQVSGHALQVCGGMGVSLEHPLHRYVKRGTVLDALLGGWRDLVTDLGAELVRTGETPRLVEV
jgi:hypothetical protein